jgi:hypothetical protein
VEEARHEAAEGATTRDPAVVHPVVGSVAPYAATHEAKREAQFRCRRNPLLAPRVIRTSHGGNQSLNVQR